jgi:hypothetical protein
LRIFLPKSFGLLRRLHFAQAEDAAEMVTAKVICYCISLSCSGTIPDSMRNITKQMM